LGQAFPAKFGEYTLLRKLAQGGMAEIFLAQDSRGQVCALKRILPHLAHEEGFIRMFLDEARIVSHLDHPNIARVYHQGKHDGFYYLAIEYVEGHSLLSVSDRARSMKIALPRGLLAYVVAELCAALAHAHSARDSKGRHLEIVHRDVTPQNVMISYEGTVKLIDFGVAKARARLTQTEAGFTKGKLSYMSPEQARGEELDGRSDLFSVGIILYEITTGNRLFNKEGPGGILSAIVNDPVPPPSSKSKGYPKDLEAVVMRALSKEVNTRWQSADELRDALMRFAVREKPKPGAARLADLVHDLFGKPEHQDLVEQSRAVSMPTPEGAVPAEMVRGASVRIRGAPISGLSTDVQEEDDRDRKETNRDDTRMMQAPVASVVSKSKSMPKLSATSASLPALSTPIEHDEIAVPEPKLPLRVRFAQALARFSQDAKASWRLYRKRWILGMAGAVGLLFIVIGVFSGLPGKIAHAIGGAADKAREFRHSAGLDPKLIDAGVKPTILRLVSEPPGALISIEGNGAGCVTPCDLPDLPIGQELKVDLALDGYRPQVERVTLWPNEGTKEIAIRLEKSMGGVVIESDPPGAFVTVNGKRLKGTTPATLDALRAGTPVTVEVKKPGHITKRKVILPVDGELVREHFKLEIDQDALPPGRIDVASSPSGCAVEISGQLAGTTPVSGFEIKAGDHEVVVRCENYAAENRGVHVEPGQTAKVQVSATPNVFGYLTIKTNPPGGNEVSVNGRKIDGSLEFLKVVPGRHVVEVRNVALDRIKTVTVDIGPNKRVSRVVDMYQ
jgi:eukaryotic-like serine/threonine-protein kinase